MSTADDKSKLYLDWREANWAELDENLRIAKSIRDNEKTSPKDKLDAIRTIARMFGALGSLRPETPPKRITEEPFKMSSREQERILEVVNEPRKGRAS